MSLVPSGLWIITCPIKNCLSKKSWRKKYAVGEHWMKAYVLGNPDHPDSISSRTQLTKVASCDFWSVYLRQMAAKYRVYAGNTARMVSLYLSGSHHVSLSSSSFALVLWLALLTFSWPVAVDTGFGKHLFVQIISWKAPNLLKIKLMPKQGHLLVNNIKIIMQFTHKGKKD
ncbi:hypothetical protein EI94DRAFT_1698597 [Lactarius quietus]|nr:hypothetical protein EI94DRAFT_1698597 [Lactarius quietus]